MFTKMSEGTKEEWEHISQEHAPHIMDMPSRVVDMLKQLEQSRSTKELIVNEISPQLEFFNISDPILEELKNDLENLNLDELTPIEALLKLNELKRKINNSYFFLILTP